MADVEPAWRAQARELRSQGKSYTAIARAVGVHHKTVERFFSMDRGFTIDFGKYGNTICEEALIEPHVTRPIRKIIKPDRMPVARRFAAGEISRAELMLEIAA